VFTNCRLVYVNSTTMQLQRFGGKFLTINDTPCLIPAAGVNLTAVAGHTGISPMYIYARMTGSVMSIEGQSAAPVLDPRNGMMVHGADPTISLVGMAYVTSGPTLVQDAANQAVSSYWNRREMSVSYYQSNATSSTSIVPLHNPVRFLVWPDSALTVSWCGYTNNANAGVANLTYLYVDGAIVGSAQVSYIAVVNAQAALSPVAVIPNPAPGSRTAQLAGYVSSGTGTWLGSIYVTVLG